MDSGVDFSMNVSLTPLRKPSASYVALVSSAYNFSIGNAFSSTKSLDLSSVPMETTKSFTPAASSAGTASRFNSTARSDAKNHPKLLRNVTTTVSSSFHSDGRSVARPSIAARTLTFLSAACASTGASSGTLIRVGVDDARTTVVVIFLILCRAA